EAQAGFHLTPQPLSSGNNIYEALGDGFTLVDLGSAGAASAFEQAAAELRVPLKVIRGPAAGKNIRRRPFWCGPISMCRGPAIHGPEIKPRPRASCAAPPVQTIDVNIEPRREAMGMSGNRQTRVQHGVRHGDGRRLRLACCGLMVALAGLPGAAQA